jgi:cytochrome b561
MSDEDRYGTVARLLHWSVAVLVLAIIPLGIALDHLPQGNVQDRAYDLHRSLGVVILVLMVLRLLWRRLNGAPDPAHDIAPWQHMLATATHHTLYLLLIVNPVVGWFATSAYGAPLMFIGIGELPALMAKNEPLANILFGVHKAIGLLTAALLIAHIGAALFHRFVLRDSVMGRMIG